MKVRYQSYRYINDFKTYINEKIAQLHKLGYKITIMYDKESGKTCEINCINEKTGDKIFIGTGSWFDESIIDRKLKKLYKKRAYKS